MSAKPDPIDVFVGARLRDRRAELGRNQSELARALGVTFQQVQKYEKGVNRVSASMLARAATFLGVTPGYFFPDADVTDLPVGPVSKLIATREGLELARLFPDLRPDCQKSLMSIVRAMAAPTPADVVEALQAA